MKKRGNSKGLGTGIDWIIAIGMFLIYLGLVFILFKPGIQPEFEGQTLLNVVQLNLEEDLFWNISQRPLFVENLNYEEITITQPGDVRTRNVLTSDDVNPPVFLYGEEYFCFSEQDNNNDGIDDCAYGGPSGQNPDSVALVRADSGKDRNSFEALVTNNINLPQVRGGNANPRRAAIERDALERRMYIYYIPEEIGRETDANTNTGIEDDTYTEEDETLIDGAEDEEEQDLDVDDPFDDDDDDDNADGGAVLNVPNFFTGNFIANIGNHITGFQVCGPNNQCPPGKICDPTNNRCVAGCNADSDCPGNRVCQNGACVSQSQGNAAVPIQGGSQSVQGPGGTTCTADSDCASGQCDLVNDVCLPRQRGTRETADTENKIEDRVGRTAGYVPGVTGEPDFSIPIEFGLSLDAPDPIEPQGIIRPQLLLNTYTDFTSNPTAKRRYLIVYSDEIINNKGGSITSSPQNDQDVQNIYRPQQKACAIVNPNHNTQEVNVEFDVASGECRLKYTLGVAEVLEGISIRKTDELFFQCGQTDPNNPPAVLDAYDCVKRRWGFPTNKDFKITIEIKDVESNPPVIIDTIIFPDVLIPEEARVDTRQFNTFILHKDATLVPATITVNIW